jgi:AAA+ ATPase superfamily predicted ATPase
LFEALFKHAFFNEILKKEKVIIVIDEFPFLIHDKAIPSVFQKIWDLIMRERNIMLVLCGSAISTMESEVLDYKTPLYGRRTGQWQLQPLDFVCLRKFLPYKAEDLMKVWFVIGGIPEYILKFNPELGFWENILHNILNKGAYLYREAEILLNEEFREPRNYKLIFKAIALGHNTLGEICNYTGLDKSMVSKYLEVLNKLHIVKEEIPITASLKFKKRIYRLVDPYFNFWFRYVYPNKIELEASRSKEVLEVIKKDFSNYAGRLFEDLVEELIRKKHVLRQFSFSRIGKWWYRDKEIYLVAFDEKRKEILFTECKWQDNVNAAKVLTELKEKAKFVEWPSNKEGRKEYYIIFAKSFRKKIKEQNLILVDICDIEKILKTSC